MTIRDLPWWEAATSNLRHLAEEHAAEASRRADLHRAAYQGRRAAMVFDVVASRQRRYVPRVLPMVERFEATASAASLHALAESGPGDGHGLRKGEADTMRQVAAGLVRHNEVHGLGEEDGVAHWAQGAGTFEHATKLEPYVGSVKGMGPALYAYLRMRCGADALKPDLRVRDALRGLGFQVPGDGHAILVVAHAAAAEIDLPLLVLDQLLWWAGE